MAGLCVPTRRMPQVLSPLKLKHSRTIAGEQLVRCEVEASFAPASDSPNSSMTEYSRAQSQRHQESAERLDMEVEKQPSPWPCAVMLLALLLCCLAAPWYWQQDPSAESTDATGFPRDSLFGHTGSSAPPTPSVLRGLHFNFGGTKVGMLGQEPGNALPNLWAPPTIEELIAARGATNQFDPSICHFNDQPSYWQPLEAPSNSTAQSGDAYDALPPSEPIEFDPEVTTSLETIGAAIAAFAPDNVVPEFAGRIFDAVPKYVVAWSNITPIMESSVSSHSTLQLILPEEQLARPVAAPKKTPWCVPQALYEQLERLAEPAYTAQWASYVGNQLHALTDRDQLEGDDVQAILSDLSGAAQEALRLAEGADDARLRVELLRAHWALARRIDCWSAMHEERVAFHVQGRVAARGELSPYFDSAHQRVAHACRNRRTQQRP